MTAPAVTPARAGRQHHRPRVVMFVPPAVTFGHDWAEAASRVADVLRVEVIGATAGPGMPGCPALARDPDDPTRYRLQRPPRLPRRLLGALADVPRIRRTLRALRWLEREHGPIDLLHGHFYPSARTFPALARRLGIPYVVTEHSTALTLESPDKVVTRRGLRIARSVYRDAAAVLPVSRSLLRAITDLGLPGRFEVVANPVDAGLFRPGPPRPERDRVDVVTVARLAPVKGVDVLLEAVAACRRRDRRVHLTVVGAGPLAAELQALAAALGLDGAVDFAGRRTRAEIAALLGRADVFALASRAENLPVALIEALMCGLPVVATAVGGVPELLAGGQGRLVPPGDPAALATALEGALAGLGRHDREAVAARARERYSMEATARALAGVYARALAGAGR